MYLMFYPFVISKSITCLRSELRHQPKQYLEGIFLFKRTQNIFLRLYSKNKRLWKILMN
nr:MAG TPA: hypothetical protein [Caudoviricetes sp.]